jgi:reductive dehalogenase
MVTAGRPWQTAISFPGARKMFFHSRSRDRPFHFGSFPLEVLPRDATVTAREAARPAISAPAARRYQGSLAEAVQRYCAVIATDCDGDVAPARAPMPHDLARRAQDIKGAAYFMDASQVGICLVPQRAWYGGADSLSHRYAVVILVEHSRLPEQDNLARDWVLPAQECVAEMRAGEIAVCIAGHIRNMGWPARAHFADQSLLDSEALAVLAGLNVRRTAACVNPFLERRYSLATVSTSYQLATDDPLHANALRRATGWRYWWGFNGAQSGRERRRQAKRQSHLGRYPMETVRQVERPTTLILDDEVPRVPKRAAFFERALQGDLGEKAQRERSRFSFKHPLSRSQLGMIRKMVPFQDGPVAAAANPHLRDPAANARAIKSLSYFLGADLTGICEIPRYAWFSHKEDGTPIEPYHRYAVVMLIDQGYDTMEGASGDDWISGAQSMRAYLRGAEIAGIIAETLRGYGFAARSQTNADSDVLHIPLILWAGLGELSRIGELVLNPFVGPRFKSVVLTTDMPLAVDKPIDFGLQYFCSHCLKCARECPCDAISFADKVVFNGYEMWKPDVERCTRYRLTNAKGSACGRCMKMCPLNKVVDSDGALITRAASWLGVNAMWLKPLLVPVATWLDDKLGNGKRVAAKKWWFDLEMVDGIAVRPKATNERDVAPGRKVDLRRKTIALYPANAMPPPDAAGAVPVDRKAAIAACDTVETPASARRRTAEHGPKPLQYVPPLPVGSAHDGRRKTGPYRNWPGADNRS